VRIILPYFKFLWCQFETKQHLFVCHICGWTWISNQILKRSRDFLLITSCQYKLSIKLKHIREVQSVLPRKNPNKTLVPVFYRRIKHRYQFRCLQLNHTLLFDFHSLYHCTVCVMLEDFLIFVQKFDKPWVLLFKNRWFHSKKNLFMLETLTFKTIHCIS